MASVRFLLPKFSSCYLCLLLVSVLFHFGISNKNGDDMLCIDGERQALLQFKHGLVDEGGLLESWVDDDQESNCCRWTGIVCDNVTGHVHGIHLRGAGGRYYDFLNVTDIIYRIEVPKKRMLKGNLSPSLLHLKQLRHLDLSCNDFGGIGIPSFIGSLGKLRYLNLSYSKFGGIIPHQLGNLSELHVLSLGTEFESTLMTSMQWLSSLRLLHHVDMSGTNLRKAIEWLQLINTLPSLVVLYLSRCQLSQIHPHVPTLNITSLIVLDLSYNNFNSSVPRWIFSISSLHSLDLSWCNFHGPNRSIDSFRNMSSLELLHVSQNDFMSSPLVLEGLSSSKLISLDIRNCGVSSSVLHNLHNLTSLLCEL